MQMFSFVRSFLVLLLLCLSTSSFADGPKFKKGSIQIGTTTIKAEFAITDAEQQHGLMNRTEIPDNFGMLFMFEDEDYRSFWMKNTFVNLSIAYIGSNKKILEIIDMEASKSSLDANPKTYPSSAKAKYALEVKQGWFAKNKIKVGDVIKKINMK
jgi:uncharacterized membrane protein (UPF0127 family)